MQAEDAILSGRGPRCGDGRTHCIHSVRDERWQTGGRAVLSVSTSNRSHSFNGRLIVKQNASAAIDLQIDEPWDEECARGQLVLQIRVRHGLPAHQPSKTLSVNQRGSMGMPKVPIKDTVGENRPSSVNLKSTHADR